MSKTPKPQDWVYRFTYDDVVSVIGFDPDLDQLAVITKALDSSLPEAFYEIVESMVEGDIDEDDEDEGGPLEPDEIPADYEVQPLRTKAERDAATGLTTCGTCELSWDDDIITSMTPAPSARCPFEYFHNYGAN